MYYAYTVFPDGLHVAYSERRQDGTVRVMFEWPMFMDMGTARCTLPGLTWDMLNGADDAVLGELKGYIASNRRLIEELADEAAADREPSLEVAHA